MKRKLFLVISLLFIFSSSYIAYTQFTPVEIGMRAEIEEFLKTAEIVNSVDIGEGVTNPKRLFLQNEDMGRMSGAWKNVEGKQKGAWEGWQYEIAAYQMDKLLDLNMIPPTVEREFKGKKGSLQFWVSSPMSELDRTEQKKGIPKSRYDNWEKRRHIARAFDCLIANNDRTQQNIRYTADMRWILIDHSRSFYSARRDRKRLVYGKKGHKEKKLIKKLPRVFLEKIKALTYDTIKDAVGPYLKDNEIKAVMLRKELLLKEIEGMIKEMGEDKFLY
ncbi:MAG: hypothetical protein GQ536_01675 [Candidatus Aminicenantes bacterium]|nr:hypothetical protein [Candidatus Aminicenantes bacterium]